MGCFTVILKPLGSLSTILITSLLITIIITAIIISVLATFTHLSDIFVSPHTLAG